MKTAFVTICDDFDNIKMSMTPVIGFFTTLGYWIHSVEILGSEFSSQSLSARLEHASVVAISFEDEAGLNKIKSALESAIQPQKYIRCRFGYIAQGSQNTCFILNSDMGDGLESALLETSISEFVPTQPSLNFKIFSLDYARVLPLASLASTGENFAIAYNSGDILVHFDSADRERLGVIERELYMTLGDAIYIEENAPLEYALGELLRVQQRRLLIQDYTCSASLKALFQPLEKQNVAAFLTERDFRNLTKARAYLEENKFDLLTIITQSPEGIILAFVDDTKCKNELLTFKSFQKYGHKGLNHLILYKIFEKFRKNTW